MRAVNIMLLKSITFLCLYRWALCDSCSGCEYLPKIAPDAHPRDVVHMNTTLGWGRTGNVVRSLLNAIEIGFKCKKLVKLPAADARGVMNYDAEFSVLDFRRRAGSVHTLCMRDEFGAKGLTGDAHLFFYAELNEDAENSNVTAIYSEASLQIVQCMRSYLGICRKGYCNEFANMSNSLIVHVRQGDIFKNNFSQIVMPTYGQPPLSFYLNAMETRHWDRVVFVSEAVEHHRQNPVLRILRLLHKHRVLLPNVLFRSSRDAEDIKLLFCAKNRVESRTTLSSALRLGFADFIITSSCDDYNVDPVLLKPRREYNGLKNVTMLTIRPQKSFAPYNHFRNSPKQWLAMLLEDSKGAVPCEGTAPVSKHGGT